MHLSTLAIYACSLTFAVVGMLPIGPLIRACAGSCDVALRGCKGAADGCAHACGDGLSSCGRACDDASRACGRTCDDAGEACAKACTDVEHCGKQCADSCQSPERFDPPDEPQGAGWTEQIPEDLAPLYVEKRRPAVEFVLNVALSREQFRAIHRADPLDGVVDEMVTYNKQYQQILAGFPIHAPKQAADLDIILDGLSGDILTFISHNDDGAIYFGDGQSIDIAALADRCSAKHKLCIFLSCSSGKYLGDKAALGLTRDIHFKDISPILDALSRKFRDPGDGIAAKDIDTLMRGQEHRIRMNYRLRKSGEVLAGAIVVYAVYETQTRNP
jgi:hypothetical protein